MSSGVDASGRVATLTPSPAEPTDLVERSEPERLARSSRGATSATMALTAATAISGLANYAYGIALTHSLTKPEYSTFAAGQAMLLLAGTLASAGVPWALARELAMAQSTAERRRATSFAARANGFLALAIGSLFAVIAYAFGGGWSPVVVGLGAAAVVLGSTCFGFLQGLQLYGALAFAIAGEVGIKVVAGASLVGAGAGGAGALAGAVLGGLAVWLFGRVAIRQRLGSERSRRSRPPRAGSPTRTQRTEWANWSTTIGMLLVQGMVAVLSTADTVLAASLGPTRPDAATYQVASTVGRIPLYLSVAVSTAMFARLVRPDSAARSRAGALALLLRLLVPGYVVIAFLPAPLLSAVLPNSYAGVGSLLPVTGAIGVGIALVNLFTTYFQAVARFRACLLVLSGVVGVTLGLQVALSRIDGVRGLAYGTLGGVGLGGLALLGLCHAVLGSRPKVRLGEVLRWIAPAVPLAFLDGHVVLWLTWAVVVGIDLLLGLRHSSPDAPTAKHRRSEVAVGPSRHARVDVVR